MTIHRGTDPFLRIGTPDQTLELFEQLEEAVVAVNEDANRAQTAADNAESFASGLSDAVTEAEHWANYPEDSLVPEGDGVDDYSALHQAAKAAASALAAATSEANAATSEANTATHEANASASATAAAASETNAQAHLEDFKGVYYGSLATDPATDPNGDAVNEGDWYWNSTDNRPRIYNGTGWQYVADTAVGSYTKAEADSRFIQESENVNFTGTLQKGGNEVWHKGNLTFSQSGGTLTITSS